MTEGVLFGERVRQLRQEKGMSQKELGQVVGLSHKAISTIEGGQRSTSIEKLILLARFFSVSPDYLLGLSDKRERM